jgi:hypothetical protein
MRFILSKGIFHIISMKSLSFVYFSEHVFDLTPNHQRTDTKQQLLCGGQELKHPAISSLCVAGICGNQAFPEMPGVPSIA